MDNNKINSDIFLPYGDILRPLLLNSNMSDSDFKKLLANKGILTNSSSRSLTIPLLSTCIISPSEFELLREKQKTKENNPKVKTRESVCNLDFKLQDIITSNLIDVNNIEIDKYSKYKPLKKLKILPDKNDSSQAYIDFEIERTDYTKDWANLSSTHKGKITLKHDRKNSKLIFSMQHTSSETADYANKIVSNLYKEMKNSNLLCNNSKIQKICCGDFTNSERFKFMLSFTDNSNLDFLIFKSIGGLEIIPDEKIKLPANINWMEKKVKTLFFSGNELHKTPYLIDTIYHDSLILYEINAYYSFDLNGIKGTCYITYGFPQTLRKYNNSSEFEVSIKGLNIPNKYNESKSNITKFILNKFMELKISKTQQLTD
ncbi:hypothetical protein [Clostridium intestinale]|uniref:GapS4b family protein n=1 Tax=Clostridium intestinale TaxID=36845 RepID=UPI0028EAE60B|nr:hypothetical protein [Clostridium intestinale]